MYNNDFMKVKNILWLIVLMFILSGCSSKFFEPLPEIYLIENSNQKISLENQVSWGNESWVLPAGDYKLYAESIDGKYYKHISGYIYRGDFIMKNQPWEGGIFIPADKVTNPESNIDTENNDNSEELFTWVVGTGFTFLTGHSIEGGSITAVARIPKEKHSDINLAYR